jgi:hypothetical protein
LFEQQTHPSAVAISDWKYARYPRDHGKFSELAEPFWVQRGYFHGFGTGQLRIGSCRALQGRIISNCPRSARLVQASKDKEEPFKDEILVIS